MERYQIIKEVGDGTFGSVYEAIVKSTGEKVAIKFIKENISSIEECMELIEVKTLKNLCHENIVKIKELIHETTGKVALIFEYCDCNLYEFTETHNIQSIQIPEQIISEIIYQILNGLNYLHSHNYFHRDIKPENILLKLNNYQLNANTYYNLNKIKIKISDFGTVQKIKNDNLNPLTDYVCTRWYRAPECILHTPYYNEKVDIWAVGCIMAELYNLCPLFEGDDEIDQMNKIFYILGTPTKEEWPKGYELMEKMEINFNFCNKKSLKNFIPRASDSAIELLEAILQFDDMKRPSCNELMNFKFFNKNKNNIFWKNNFDNKYFLNNSSNNIIDDNNFLNLSSDENKNYKRFIKYDHNTALIIIFLFILFLILILV